MKKAIALALVVLSGIVVESSFADTLELVTPAGAGFSSNHGFIGVSNLVYDNTQDFIGFCTSRTVDAYYGQTWNVAELTTTSFQSVDPNTLISTPNPTEGAEIAYLTNLYGGTSDNATAAEIQLAIWDIGEGGNGTVGDTTPLNASYWSFTGSALTSTQIIDAAAAYSASAIGKASTSTYFEAQRINGTPVSQDFVAPTPSPEPVTLGLGIAGIAMAVRRRFARR